MKKYKYKGETVRRVEPKGGYELFKRDSDNELILIKPDDEDLLCLNEFKKGDIVYRPRIDVYGIVNSEIVYIYDSCDIKRNRHNNLACYRFYHDSVVFDTTSNSNTGERLATDAEKKRLFNGLYRLGKYWDAEDLEVKDLVRVPYNIPIYKFDNGETQKEGDGLHIGFNDNKQILWVDTSVNVYVVSATNEYFFPTKCYLKPVKKEELVIGDTVFVSTFHDFESENKYYKYLGDEFVRPNYKSVSVVEITGDVKYYKLIPIND